MNKKTDEVIEEKVTESTDTKTTRAVKKKIDEYKPE